jgi:protein-S-isoprenylcysteine O-methyltransferase Ste14
MRKAILLRAASFPVMMAGCLFLSAGRWDIPAFWIVTALWTTAMVVSVVFSDPELVQERIAPGAGGQDYLLRRLAFPSLAACWIVAGLDVGRFHWTDRVPAGVQIAAVVLFAASLGFAVWATLVNRFFSSVVRIQSERGHHVVKEGPYRWLRHPGYASSVVVGLAAGPALGSWMVVVPALAMTALVLRRTVIEDRFLHENLAGYAEYAREVRYRLLPGVW